MFSFRKRRWKHTSSLVSGTSEVRLAALEGAALEWGKHPDQSSLALSSPKLLGGSSSPFILLGLL